MRVTIIALSVSSLCGCIQTSRYEKKNDMPWRNYGPDTNVQNQRPQNNNPTQNWDYQRERAIMVRRQQEAKEKAAAASGKQ
jgi:hypothetical protein